MELPLQTRIFCAAEVVIQLVLFIGFFVVLWKNDASQWLVVCGLHSWAAVLTSGTLAIPIKNDNWQKYYGILVSLGFRVVLWIGSLTIFILFGQQINKLCFIVVFSLVISFCMMVTLVVTLIYMCRSTSNVTNA